MKKLLRSLVHYPYAERRGIFVLTAFIAVFFLFESTRFFIEREKYSKLIHIAQIPVDTTILFPQKESINREYTNYSKLSKKSNTLTLNTNPNTLQKQDWINLGLSPKQAETTIKFRDKIGGFKSIADLQKCFTIPKNILERNQHYFIFPEISNSNIENRITIKLNSCDSADLTVLKGIGPKLASRIIKFRNRIGAFHSTSQLKDVYGIEEDLYQSIEPQLEIDPGNMIKIRINYAQYKDFAQLPYLEKDEIKNIINFREKNGFYTNLYMLVEHNIINDEKYFKIAPYLLL